MFFTLKDIFTIKKAKNITLDMAKESLGNEIPYITRTKFNNGANFFVQKENFKIEKGNCITIGGEGANVFYQPFDFISGNNTTKLYHDKLNENSGLFIISILNLEKYRYSYNRA
ncbi:MAG: restriction endonuclease subunit S [Methanobrevibacter sp.]|nr:restriction endonuclease subunit S [Methanobrevibacter sp.]